MRVSHLSDNEHTVCQIGVFAAYVSSKGHAFIDRALYLPKAWTDDPVRCKAAHVPSDTGFATKPQLAARMIARAIASGVPFRWVAADTVYGVGDIERDLRRAAKGYVLGVDAAHVFRSWDKPRRIATTAKGIAEALEPSDWKRLSAGAGTKGPRLHDWCYLELADLEADEYNEDNQGLWTRGMLIRRNIADGDLAYFTTWCPAGTSIETLVKVEGHRWAEVVKVPPAQQVEYDRRGSRTASRPPKTSSVSTTMKPAPGMAGTAMSRSSCSPSR
ncbi:transposase IS4 [Acidocella aminolytica 101 = DSM 11237]|uniref:Transposase IS4 n=1 Tax=Acidocella aminolytica 101 = DSM 11237 TaxID=1120923 RepID=A0A0D6PLP6_9PROT|nr:transposase IS4 [Acidocella aminolytica 101 = DSM 11237]